jgi:hypothetical protein
LILGVFFAPLRLCERVLKQSHAKTQRAKETPRTVSPPHFPPAASNKKDPHPSIDISETRSLTLNPRRSKRRRSILSQSSRTVPGAFLLLLGCAGYCRSQNLAVIPLSFTFDGAGGSRSLAVSTGDTPRAWTASINAPWLAITTAAAGVGSGVVTFSVEPNLTGVPRNAVITLSSAPSTGDVPSVDVPIVENPQPEPQVKLVVSPSSLTFSYRAPGPAPPPQTLTVSANGNHTVRISAEVNPRQPWVSVTGGGNTPACLTVTVSPSGLAAGVYEATVVVHGVDDLERKTHDESVPVTLTVTAAPGLTVLPGQLTFQYQVGGASPAAQNLRVDTTTGAAISYSASTAPGASWLQASGSGRTPGEVRVSASPGSLPAGTYQGSVVVTSAEASNSPRSIPVTLTVTPAPVLTSAPAFVDFQHRQQTPAPSPVTLTINSFSTGPQLPQDVSAVATAPWLRASGGGATPASVTVTVNPTGLAPGSYSDYVTVTSTTPGVAPLRVPVTLTELAAPTLIASPQQLFFKNTSGASDPPPQMISLAVNPPPQMVSFTATASTSAGGNWLSVAPASGSAPGALTVSIHGGSLGSGVYHGNVTVTSTAAANSPLQIPVTLTLEAAPDLQANPESLSFDYQALSPTTPPDQQLTVTTSNGSSTAVSATATTSSGGPWLSVQATGTAPGSLQVSVKPAGLAQGSYAGVITITASGYQPETVSVSLRVSSAPALDVLPAALTFAYQTGGAVPLPQTASVSSSPPGIPFAVSASDAWIHATGGGVTNSTISVSVDPTGLAAGSYRGSVAVTSTQAGNSPVLIQVDLTVTTATVISASPASLHFAYTQQGAIPAPQSVSISSNNPIAFTTSVSPATPWLTASAGGTTPATVTVTVDPTGLSPGDYEGSVLVNAPGAANTPLVIPVTVSVSAAPRLQATPTQLTFAYQLGGAAPEAQALTITSSGAPLQGVAASSGVPWLTVAGSGGATPAVFTVSANGSQLTAGTYQGSITVTSAGAANSPLMVPVTFIVTAAPVLEVSPGEVSFAWQIGQPLPANQHVTVTSSAGALDYTAAASTDSGGLWLSAQGGGATPSVVDIHCDPAGLAAGTYTGKVTLSSGDASNSPLAIPVTLVVTNAVTLTSSPASLSFTYEPPLSAPAPQQVRITSSGAQIAFASSVAAGSAWLSVTGDAHTPGNLTVSVNPTGLAPGDYAGTVVIQSDAAGNNPLEVPVSLHVTMQAALNATPQILRFNYVMQGALTGPQTVNVTSSGSPLDFHGTASSGAPWIQVSGGGATPGALQVSVNPAGLAVGNYAGAVVVSSSTVNTFEIVAVELTVSSLTAPSLIASPQQLVFMKTAGASDPPAQTVSLSLDTPQATVSFNASASTSAGGNWLSVAPEAGTAPGTLTVSIHAGSLGPGVYQGNITVTSSAAANSPLQIPVTFTVEEAPALSSNPQSLTFDYQALSPTVPPDQQLTVTTTNGSSTAVAATASTSSGGAWLSVQATSAAPGTLQVSVKPTGLAAGSYGGTITITANGYQPETVPVSLKVSSAPSLNVLPAALTFAYEVGGSAPLPQTASVSSSQPGLPFTVSASDPWIHVTGGGSTNSTISVSVDPTGLAGGFYRGSVAVTSSQAGNSPVLVQVDLTVTTATIVSASPASLHFVYTQQGAVPAPQPVSITSNKPIAFTTSVSTATPWLSASAGGTTPATVTVTVDPTGLSPGDYEGSVLVNASGAANTPLVIPVTVSVSAAPRLQAIPAQLTFAYQLGGAAPPAQALTITSSGTPVQVTAAASPGAPWLTVAGSGGSTPAVFTVSANGSQLTAGTYQAAVVVTSAGAANSPVTVPVTFVVTAAPVLEASPGEVNFAWQIGQALPANQQVAVASSGGPLDYTVAASTDSGGLWLSAQGGGTTPSVVDIHCAPAGMAAGTYTGKVTLSSGGASNSPLVIPVTLVVTNAVTLIAAPASLSFTYEPPLNAPAPQQIRITSSGAQIAFSSSVAAGAPWLAVAGDATTPGNLTVTVNPTGLAPGDYAGTVVVQSDAAGNNPLEVPVSLHVTAQAALNATPQILRFDYQVQGPLPGPQIVTVTSSGSPLDFHATVSSGAPWIQVSGGGTTPGALQVSIKPAGLGAGNYAGAIVVASSAGNTFEIVAVELSVSEVPAPPALIASPQALFFKKTVGASDPQAKMVSLAVEPPSGTLSFSASASTSGGGNWLSVLPAAGSAPGVLTVSIHAGSLGAGVYLGSVKVISTTAANSPVEIPVTLTVEAAPDLQANPQSLSFDYQALSPTVPPDQQLTVKTSNGSTTAVTAVASTSSGGAWLSVQASGAAPGTLQIHVIPTGLAQGSYGGIVTISASGYTPETVPVSLTVSSAPALNVLPTALTFAYQTGGSVPLPQTLSVSSSQPGIPFSASASDSWIHVTGGGPTNSTLSVSVDPTGLAAGSHRGSVAVTSSQAANSPVLVQVDLVVTTATVVSASPASLRFVYTQLGAVPPSQPVSISSNKPIGFTTSVSPATPWLTVSTGGFAPAIVTVTVDPRGLAPGEYEGSVLVDAPEAANSPVVIPVTVSVAAAPFLQASPPQLTFAYQLGGAQPVGQALTITSSGAPVQVTAAASSNAPWLTVAGSGGATPSVFTVTANGAQLTAGTFQGEVVVTSAGVANSPLKIPVTFIVTAAPVLEVSSGEVSFAWQTGQPLPANQQVTVTSSAGSLDYTAAASTDTGGSWLSALGGGATPSVVDIRCDPTGMSAGTYTGKVTLSSGGAGNSPVVIPVTLVVTSAITLTASPASLSFNYEAPSASPASQQIRITSSGAQTVFSSSIAAGAPWLAVSGDTVTPGALTVSVNPAGLAPGDYAGTVVIQSDAAANNPLEIPVSLHVTAQTSLNAVPQILRFNYLTQGALPDPQTVNVTSSGSALDFHATVSPGAPWIQVSGGGTTPGALQVSVNPAGLNPGNYAGVVVVSSSTVHTVEIVAVTLSVSTLPKISTFPAALTFQYQSGGSPPVNQILQVTSDSGSIPVTAAATTVSGGSWLSADGSGNTPFQLQVSVNPSGLAPGIYAGEVTLTSSGAGNSPYLVPVTLTVSAAPVLSGEPAALAFAYTIGGPIPPPGQLQVTADTPTPATVVPSTTNGVAWLSTIQAGNTTPLSVTVSVDPTGLSAGVHTGTLSVNSPVAGNSPLLIPVTFSISAQPVLQASPSSASFVYTPGETAPPPLIVEITSGSRVLTQASVSPPTSWLTVSGGGVTPADLQLSANPAGLAPGTYTSSVLVTSPGAANSPLSIPVTLQVTNLPALVTAPASISINTDVQSTASASLVVGSTGTPLAFTATPAAGAPWLTVSGAGTTPTLIAANINTAGLSPGSYTSAIVITAAGAVNSPLLVPVTVTVLTAPTLTVTPATMTFSSSSGGASQSQTLTVLLGGQPAGQSQTLPLRPSPWMSIQSGAPGSFVVTADPSAVGPGEYLAGVAITESTASNSPALVPIHLSVASVPVQIAATSVALSATNGTNTATTDTIHIAGGPTSFTLEVTGGSWLRVAPETGNIPVDLMFTADPTGLSPGSYHGAITIHPKGAADIVIGIVLGVGDATSLTASPQSVTFSNPQGVPAPAAQSIAISSPTAGIGLQIAPADSWLSVDSPFVTTPGRFNVTANVKGLAPGPYHSQITVTKAGATTGALAIPVDLYVGQTGSPTISSINHGASFFYPAAMAPGLIFSIFGSGLGPKTPVIPAISGGQLPTAAAGVQVLVNGIPCPLLYVSDSQLNAIASFALSGNTTNGVAAANVVAQYQGISTDPVPLVAAAAAPGVFSLNSSGTGPGAILNLDNSVNSPTNPATRGSYVAMFAAGGGQTIPPGLDGSIYPAAGWMPQLPVTVSVGGIDAPVSYAGAAPGFVQGALQVNFQIPANAPAGENVVILKIGNAQSQPLLTVSVR